MPDPDPDEQLARVSQEQLVAAVLALLEGMPDDFAYRSEMSGHVAAVMAGMRVPAGWFDTAVHEHGVEIDRVLRPKTP